MQDSVLETLLVVDYPNEIWTQNLLNFIVKFGSKAEICWTLSFKLFVGTYITFLKGYDADFGKI